MGFILSTPKCGYIGIIIRLVAVWCMNSWAGHPTDSTKENRKYPSSKMSKWTLTGLQLLQETQQLCCFELRDLFFFCHYIFQFKFLLESFARVRMCWPLIDCFYPSNPLRRLWWHSTMKFISIKTSRNNLVWERKCREFIFFPQSWLLGPQSPSETLR